MPEFPDKPPDGWWQEAFPLTPSPSALRGHPRGNAHMLILVTYDITCPKRLKKVADCCLDFGIRVQYSVFECRLEADQYLELWNRLTDIADKKEDKIVAYPIGAGEARKIKCYGQQMILSETVIAYIF